MVKRKEFRRSRRAQLLAEAVTVCCPFCGEAQPNHTGSEMWIAEDFAKKSGVHYCVSCEEPIMIFSDSKAQFTGAKS